MTASRIAEVSLPLPPPYKYKEVVAAMRSQIATIQQCPQYATTPTVQAAAANLTTGLNTLDTTLTNHDNAVALVATLDGQRRVELSDTLRLHDGLASALNLASNGDAKAALAWTGKVKQRVKTTPTTDPPINAVVKPVLNASGEVIASCKYDPQARVYLFQMGTDPAHPETWPAPVMSESCKYKVTGQAPGTKLYFRVAIFRIRTGQGAWSEILSVTVR
jgi:hypothetical protein